MKIALWTISIGLSLAVIIIFVFFGYFNYSVKTMHITETLANDVEFTSEKREITFENPLKGKKRIQEIALSIDGYKPDIGNADQKIKLDDGTILDSEIELVDENNNAHQLEFSGQTFQGEKVLVRFREKNKSSGNVAFKAVRFSSDKPFRCTVFWKDYDLK